MPDIFGIMCFFSVWVLCISVGGRLAYLVDGNFPSGYGAILLETTRIN